MILGSRSTGLGWHRYAHPHICDLKTAESAKTEVTMRFSIENWSENDVTIIFGSFYIMKRLQPFQPFHIYQIKLNLTKFYLSYI